MTECISVSGGHGMDLPTAPLDVFSSSGSNRQSPTSPHPSSDSVERNSSFNSSHGLQLNEDIIINLHESNDLEENHTTSNLNNNDDDDLLGGCLEKNESEENEGVCGVCQESYTQPPRVLNCLHVFCEACLLKQQRPLSSSPAHNNSVPSAAAKRVVCCPTCHYETECHQGVKSLPLDYVLINRLDAEAIHKRTVVCTSCKSEDHAIARCQDCSSFLCPSCEKAHSSMLCFENHQVVSFESFDQNQAEIHRSVNCLRHPREIIQLYDPTCGTALCNECLVSGHQGHGCKKVTEVEQTERADLRKLITEAKLKFKEFDETNDSLNSSLTELQLTRDSVRSSIEEAFVTYKTMLEKVKNSALEELERVHTEQEMRVMDDIQLCQESRVNLEHSIKFSDKLAKYGDATEFLALKMLVTCRVRKLMHSCPKSKNTRDLKFVSDESKFEAVIEELFGKVVAVEEDVLDSERSSFSLLGTSLVPEISNTSAARLLPSELVDAVNSSSISSSHFGPLESHSLLQSPQIATGAPHPSLDPIVSSEDCQLDELRSALAQINLARLAGVASAEPDVDSEVLPMLVGGVNDVVSSGRMIVGPDNSRMAKPVTTPVPSIDDNHLLMNLSALAKLTTPRTLVPEVVPPSVIGVPPVVSAGQRSPTPSVGTVTILPPTSAPTALSNRNSRMTPMHIRIKFGQLGSGHTQFSSPHGFCLGPNEEIVVADTNNHRIQIFDKAGEFKSEFGSQGKEEGQLWYPRKVAVMKASGTYVICDRGNERSRMQLFTKNGEFIKKIAIRYIDIVAGLALTSDGRIVAVDSVSPTVFVIAEGGDLLLWFDCSEHMREPSDIAVWGSEFYICDFKGHCVVVYSECGNFLRRIGGEGLTNFPNGIDISDHGDILVGDSHGNRFHIVVFNREGHAVSEFECPYCKVSRCCGLKITSEGYVVTLAKNNHHVLILNTLYIS